MQTYFFVFGNSYFKSAKYWKHLDAWDDAQRIDRQSIATWFLSCPFENHFANQTHIRASTRAHSIRAFGRQANLTKFLFQGLQLSTVANETVVTCRRLLRPRHFQQHKFFSMIVTNVRDLIRKVLSLVQTGRNLALLLVWDVFWMIWWILSYDFGKIGLR